MFQDWHLLEEVWKPVPPPPVQTKGSPASPNNVWLPYRVAQSARWARRGMFSGVESFLAVLTPLSWVSSEDYGYCRTWERCNSALLFEVMAAWTNALMFFQDLKQNKMIAPVWSSFYCAHLCLTFLSPLSHCAAGSADHFWFSSLVSLLSFFKKDVEGPHQVI